ncbi:MAG: flavodoxin domain-containing protein [Oscillospiraceae bacterium]|jgi:hypothetical protein
MVIVYESKTGFTKKYADLLAAKTGLKVFGVKDLATIGPDAEIIFLGWLKAGMIQGLKKVRKYNLKAVCASGTAPTAEPNAQTIMARNKIENIPFFYVQGGCLPIKEIKGMDKIMLSIFVSMLKKRKVKDEKTRNAIDHIENGFDGVKEEHLSPVLEWLNTR